MVAANKYFHHNDATAGDADYRLRVTGYGLQQAQIFAQFVQSVESVDRILVAPRQRPPCPSISSATSVFQKSADQRYRAIESYPQGGTGIPAGEINYIYYDSQWQAIETRTNGTAASNVSSQMVWSAAYINAAILRDSYIAGVIQPNSRIYFLQDANWNTTAAVGLINAAWQVLQYYVYSPYGTITVLNEDGAGSTPIVNNLYQGMTLDPVTGLYYARNRNYSPTLGRWINQDPAGYINGVNTYQFVMSNPVGNVDAEGLCPCYKCYRAFNQERKQLQQQLVQEAVSLGIPNIGSAFKIVGGSIVIGASVGLWGSIWGSVVGAAIGGTEGIGKIIEWGAYMSEYNAEMQSIVDAFKHCIANCSN